MAHLLPLLLPLLLLAAVPHELAHLVAARAFGVTVLEFGIGLPPRAVTRQWRGIRWSICWLLPLGAYVKLKGEDGGDAPDDFAARPAWQQSVVALAGPLANLVIGAIAAGALLALYGQPAVGRINGHLTAATQMVGWVGLAQVMDELAYLGIPTAAWFLALLACFSAGLGLTNLLPVLPLDGGRIALAFLQQALRKPRLLAPRAQTRVNVAGFALLLAVFGGVTALDVVRLVNGQAVLLVVR